MIYYTKGVINNIIEIKEYFWFVSSMKVDVHRVQINFTKFGYQQHDHR